VYLSGARCRLAYGPADATATHYLCFSKIQIGFTFWYRLTWVVPDKRPLTGCVCVVVCRFYARDSGLVKFKIHTGALVGRTVPPPANARRLVAFTFHPSEPFAISIQRMNTEYVVNFHVRHCPSV